jgi:hypothetical protein
MKTLVAYVFHEYNDRVKQFIKDATFKDDEVDFLFIANNKTIEFEIPSYAEKIQRDNIGYDFGGWSEALLTGDRYKKYDYFICVNSSVVGPFIPSYCRGRWTDIYIYGLKDNVKLFGSTINTIEQPRTNSHVQSYIFSMDKETLEFLIKANIFSLTNLANTFEEAIWNKEVEMSRKIIGNGWNIGSLLPCYRDVDFTFSKKSPEEYNITYFNDLMYEPYRGPIWNEHQLVFIKGNRVPINYVP